MKEQIVRVKGTDRVPILLVGNKVDIEHQREVSKHEGIALAQIWNSPFLETSAKIKANVDSTFAEIVREMSYNCGKEKPNYCCSHRCSIL